MKLLLVEDDPEICGMLKKFLEKENFEIITANDGEEACSKFRQETCDLVLLDLMLPKISGMDVLQQIRAQSTVPIIIMSAKDTDSDITLGLGLGADDYVTKPFSMVQVLGRYIPRNRFIPSSGMTPILAMKTRLTSISAG